MSLKYNENYEGNNENSEYIENNENSEYSQNNESIEKIQNGIRKNKRMRSMEIYLRFVYEDYCDKVKCANPVRYTIVIKGSCIDDLKIKYKINDKEYNYTCDNLKNFFNKFNKIYHNLFFRSYIIKTSRHNIDSYNKKINTILHKLKNYIYFLHINENSKKNWSKFFRKIVKIGY